MEETSLPIVENSDDIIIKKDVSAETIEISKDATKSILNSVEKQRSKYWHFQFKSDKDKEDFTRVLQNINGYSLTAEYNDKQNTPDITLRLGNEIVGKIHLLLCDRRDTNNKEKYYCKIYFYHFKDPKLYDAVKSAVINFFEGFQPSMTHSNIPLMNSSGGRRGRRTHKKKRNIKKKTKTRK